MREQRPAGWQVTTDRDIAELDRDVAPTLKYDELGHFFASSEWLTCLARHGLVEAPPIAVVTASNPTASGQYRLSMMADGNATWRSLTNYYSLRAPAIAGPAPVPDDAARALARSLVALSDATSELSVRRFGDNDDSARALTAALTDEGWRTRAFHDQWNWYSDVAGRSFADYWASRSSQLRNTTRRKQKQAAREHRIAVTSYNDTASVEQGLDGYAQVYAASWKAPEATTAFIPALARLCARLGTLRLAVLSVDDEPAAAQLWITTPQTAYIYKLAHDARFDALSAGSILSRYMFEEAIDRDNVAEIDFGIGDEPYKQAWVDSRRALLGIRALNPRTLRGRFRIARAWLRNARADG